MDAIFNVQVLEFLPEFVDALKNEGYTLTEYEASILLPCLIEKVCLFFFVLFLLFIRKVSASQKRHVTKLVIFAKG